MATKNDNEFRRSEGVIGQRPFHDFITGKSKEAATQEAAGAKAAPRPRIRLYDEEAEGEGSGIRRQGARAGSRPIPRHHLPPPSPDQAG